MQILDGHAFGTEIAAAEDVRFMAANASHFAVCDGQFQSAAGFAKRADAMGNSFRHMGQAAFHIK